jgi:predicted RNA-binding Zn ribbon-like protein
MSTSSASAHPAEAVSAPGFRLDNEQLAFRFTATLTDRHGTPLERLPTPDRLGDWLAANRLDFGSEAATPADLDLAHRMREAIHQAGTAIATGTAPEVADLGLLNGLLRDERLYPELIAGGLVRWHCTTGRHIRGALSLIAHDAVTLLGSPRHTHVKVCENPECGGLYVDTSRGQNRRWCSMNICGNRAKKARFRVPQGAGTKRN